MSSWLCIFPTAHLGSLHHRLAQCRSWLGTVEMPLMKPRGTGLGQHSALKSSEATASTKASNAPDAINDNICMSMQDEGVQRFQYGDRQRCGTCRCHRCNQPLPNGSDTSTPECLMASVNGRHSTWSVPGPETRREGVVGRVWSWIACHPWPCRHKQRTRVSIASSFSTGLREKDASRPCPPFHHGRPIARPSVS